MKDKFFPSIIYDYSTKILKISYNGGSEGTVLWNDQSQSGLIALKVGRERERERERETKIAGVLMKQR